MHIPLTRFIVHKSQHLVGIIFIISNGLKGYHSQITRAKNNGSHRPFGGGQVSIGFSHHQSKAKTKENHQHKMQNQNQARYQIHFRIEPANKSSSNQIEGQSRSTGIHQGTQLGKTGMPDNSPVNTEQEKDQSVNHCHIGSSTKKLPNRIGRQHNIQSHDVGNNKCIGNQQPVDGQNPPGRNDASVKHLQ